MIVKSFALGCEASFCVRYNEEVGISAFGHEHVLVVRTDISIALI